jgi:formamidopyrimidine-DNA glycosylase
MPELPDVVVYLEALRARIEGRVLEGVRLGSPFVLRSVDPPLAACAGRLRWKKAGAKIPGKLGLAAFDFESGTLLLTEAGSRKRASLHVAAGEQALVAHDRGGLEVLDAELPAFADAVRRETHTLKRTLTDPRLLSGIGNAYSDEILHRARLSPFKLTDALTDDEIARLFDATRDVLNEWTRRLSDETGEAFPEKVTAFREQMAVHGRHRQPCPVCGSPVQRIVYSSNETNYCATCQTGGKLLADRALSRLLRKDWPRTIEELEEKTK